jgi:energy-coupling factor transporter ATP-binding protein EcfA2
MTEPLSHLISPVPRYARASNLERDSGEATTADYHLVAPGLDVIRRIIRVGDTRALVVTGPFGSGKSTFALFLDALLGPASSPMSVAARARLREADPSLADALVEYHGRLAPEGAGPIRAIATGRPEPIAETALRALLGGIERYPTVPARLRARIRGLVGHASSSTAVAAAYREVRKTAPIALIIDELGVVLDAAADAANDGVWLLQELAEAMSADGSPASGFLIGLQHRSLAEQIGAGHELPASWRKIQGRFEEIAFVESRDALFSLIPRVLRRHPDGDLDAAVKDWASGVRGAAAHLGLERFLPIGIDALSACYPLHPSVLLVLPDLTSYYGQRERTLLAFLAGGEPYAVTTFLDAHLVTERPLPSVDLPAVYEFFVGSGSHRLGAPGRVSRWVEVERRIREAGELDPVASKVVRAIALLNLIGRGGPVRASAAILEFAVPGGSAALTELVASGLLTYRSTTDEYRIWEGSDVDLDAAIAASAAAVEPQSLASLLTDLAPLAPVVAAAHSEKTGVLRTFERRYLREGQPVDDVKRDGLVLYRVDLAAVPAAIKGELPTIVLTGGNLDRLRAATVNAAALALLTANDELSRDWVALREVRERHGMALDALRDQLDMSFEPSRTEAVLHLDGATTALSPDLLSRLASAASDRAFPKTPRVRNEMFAIHELTSQGARARSLLLGGMIERPELPSLGFEGWGPERAMYASILATGKLHLDTVPFFGPSEGSEYREVWNAIRNTMFKATQKPVSVESILASVEARPYGLRRSQTPILWLAVVLAEAEQLAVFERGSFLPRLTADALDRLVKTPDAFTIRHLAARGARQDLVEQLNTMLSLTRPGVPTVVDVVGRLIQSLRRMAPYALKTHQLSDQAVRVRAALLTAKEPDVLLFDALPAALDEDPVDPSRSLPPHLAERLSGALVELSVAYRVLQDRVRRLFAEAFDLTGAETLRTDLRVRSQPLLRHVVEPRMRGFLAAATETSLTDDEWLGALIVATGSAPLEQWDDSSEVEFAANLRDLARTHRRLAVLYTEAWAQDLSDGFVARRVTVTESSGHETSRLVWIDAGHEGDIGGIIDEALRQAEHLAGPEAARMIVALLIERLAKQELRDDPAQSDHDERLA